MDSQNDPESFYDEYADSEWERLDTGFDGYLEYEFTKREVKSVLPDPNSENETIKIIDAGGGAGRYSVWLAEQGYHVTLVDISREQLGIAQEKVRDHGVEDRVRFSKQNITELGFDDDTFDATLCLGGPVSHILDEARRTEAVNELRRVTRPDSPICISVMGLLGFIQLKITTGHNVGVLPELIEHGDYHEDILSEYGYENLFTSTHFFRRNEFEELLEKSGISVSKVTALEGLGSLFHDEELNDRAENLPDEEIDAIEETMENLRDDPVVADMSLHMLGIGWV